MTGFFRVCTYLVIIIHKQLFMIYILERAGPGTAGLGTSGSAVVGPKVAGL